MRRRALYAVAALLLASRIAAQHPIFDVDDFVDPDHHDGGLFITRLILGGAVDYADEYRPLGRNAAFISVANGFYWDDFQLDYKHSEVRGGESDTVFRCGACDAPVYFPTPPPSNAMPAPPRPGVRDSVQFAWYDRSGETVLRYRATWTHQAIETAVRSAASQHVLPRVSGDEQSFGVEADTVVRFRGHHAFGLLAIARTVRNGSIDPRTQNALTYMSRLPGMTLGQILLRATVTVGRVSNRGGTALNLVNPAFEAYWQDRRTRANLHVIWSPLVTNSGVAGWKANEQIAVFVDRAVYVKSFRKRVR